MKKITVKHYLNKNLKSTEDSEFPVYVSITTNSTNIKRKSGSTGCLLLPLSEEDLKDKQVKRHIAYEKDLYTRIITLLLNDYDNNSLDTSFLYFLSKKGYNSKDEFINMLNSYIDFYSFSIYNAIDNYCTKKIEQEIYTKISALFNISINDAENAFKYNYHYVNHQRLVLDSLSNENIELFVMNERLREYLSVYSNETGYDIPYIDWQQNIIQPKLKKFFKTYKREPEFYLPDNFEFTDSLIEKYIKTIDSIVNSTEYFSLSRLD